MTPYKMFYSYACYWVSKRFTAFTIKDIKKAYQDEGNCIDGLINTSGALAKQLLKEGRVFKLGYTTQLRPNGKEQVVYSLISREYKEKQSNNRKGDESLTINFDE